MKASNDEYESKKMRKHNENGQGRAQLHSLRDGLSR